jgi:hypothetical protein
LTGAPPIAVRPARSDTIRQSSHAVPGRQLDRRRGERPTIGAKVSAAPVCRRRSSSRRPSSTSRTTMPTGVISMTARSVKTRLTQHTAVSGNVHLSSNRGGTGGRGPQSEVLGRVERGFDFLGEASHRHCATHCSCACRHVALEMLSHRCLLHCSRQLFARPPPWAATAGNENCIATRMASAASVYLVM